MYRKKSPAAVRSRGVREISGRCERVELSVGHAWLLGGLLCMERVFCLCVIVWNRREGKLQSCSCGDRERASPHRRHRPALPAAGRDDVGAPKSCMQFRSDLRAAMRQEYGTRVARLYRYKRISWTCMKQTSVGCCVFPARGFSAGRATDQRTRMRARRTLQISDWSASRHLLLYT